MRPTPPSLSQLYILSTTLAYSITWFVPLADELATLSYYCIVGYRFRPMEANMYLKVGEVRYFCGRTRMRASLCLVPNSF